MRVAITAFAVSSLILLSISGVHAAKRTNVGTLTCTATTTKTVTKPVLRKLSCSFERFGAEEKESYEGEIIHRGPNVTMRSEEVLVWNVWRLDDKPDARPLIGKYFGLRKDDPRSPGLGANTLVGGGTDALLLEPVVNPGTADTAVTVLAVVELELRPARI